MSISKHDQKLILVLLGLAVFLAAYFGICKTFNDKKDAIETQITARSARLDELLGFQEKQTTYKSETDKIDAEMNTELKKYPSDVRSEDMIMYATELENKVGIKVQSISIASPDVVTKFSVAKKSGDSFTLVPVVAVRTGLTMNCTLNYEQFKKLMDYVYGSPEKTDVANVSINYAAESGGLSCVITIEKYFITSTDYTYTQTNIPSVAKGTTNPFGTTTKPAASPKPSTTPSAG